MFANSIRNMLASAIPALVNLCTIPYIVKALGGESYGAFTLIGSIIGYFSLLDINVTSGSVKFVAEHDAKGEKRELFEVISFGGTIYLLIGIIGSSALFFFAESLISYVFNVSAQQNELVTLTLKIAAVGFFLNQIQVYLNSIPQSLNRFDITSVLEIFFGIVVPLFSVLLLWLGYGLREMVTFRVAASGLNVLLLLWIITRLIPDFRWVWPSKVMTRKLASFSGYAYLSRIAAITYNHADRLVLGSLVSMTELTYYTVPSTLVNRLLGLTFRIASVFYPLASKMDALGDHEQLERLYLSATRYLNYINTFFVLVLSLFAYQILSWWLGDEFARSGRWIMVTMSLAMLFDSFTNLPSLLSDALGYPRITGMFTITRAAVALGLTIVLTKKLGIFGAALSHLIAFSLSSVLFLFFAHRKVVPVRFGRLLMHSYLPTVLIAAFCVVLFLALKYPLDSFGYNPILAAPAVVATYLLFGLIVILKPEHRGEIFQRCRNLFEKRVG